jgi:hypothetical protein
MASAGKKKTTMAKRDRENRLRERRAEKQAKKEARKLASQAPQALPETAQHEPGASGAGSPVLTTQLSPSRTSDRQPATPEAPNRGEFGEF